MRGELGSLSARLEAVIEKALAKDVKDRYQSAAALADELSIVLEEHRRSEGLTALPREALDELSGVRKLIKVGDADEAQRRLGTLFERFPSSPDVWRARRAAEREAEKPRRPSGGEEEYPELSGTFDGTPTRRESETVAELAAEPSSPQRQRSRRGFALGMGIAAVVLLAALAGGGALLFLRRGPVESRIAVRSRPPGASILVDGQDTGIVTDGALVLPGDAVRDVRLTIRHAGMREESRSVKLPAPEGTIVSVDLVPLVTEARLGVVSEPPGATVSLDGVAASARTPTELVLDPGREHEVTVVAEGFAPQHVRVAPGPEPAAINIRLEPSGPPGSVTVSSSYPLEVSWRGRVLARGQLSPTVTVPGGRQTLTISAPAVFLRRELTLDVVAGGRRDVAAPGLGRLSVRALPDNCEVFLDGAFLDHPPVLDKPVAAGSRVVSFRWPDGARFEETVEVVEGKSAFSTGRKE